MKQKTSKLAQVKQWILSIVVFRYFRQKYCYHEFSGLYNIRVSNMTVEMNCNRCGKLNAWTFEQWEQIHAE